MADELNNQAAAGQAAGTVRAEREEAAAHRAQAGDVTRAMAMGTEAFSHTKAIADPTQLPYRVAASRAEGAIDHKRNLQESGIPDEVLSALLPGTDVVELSKPEVKGGIGYRFVKRSFDIVSCSAALILLAIPMAILAVLIKLDSPGPVFYAQRRVGKNGKVFELYKFRSMYIDAEKRGAQWATEGDPRITPLGKKMRNTRLDELPQFWNVVKGDMSLIGPRPERPAFCDEFEKRIHGWHYRTCVRPGVSGLAQVMGGYDLLPKEKVVFDLEYIANRSAKTDAAIIVKTLKTVVTGDGAH